MTTPEPIVEFLTRCLDEDERVARAVTDSDWHEDVVTDQAWNEFSEQTWQHITHHDPARVLRQVAAHRRILAEHEPLTEVTTDCAVCDRDGPCDTLRYLALIYSDRDGFDPNWAVEALTAAADTRSRSGRRYPHSTPPIADGLEVGRGPQGQTWTSVSRFLPDDSPDAGLRLGAHAARLETEVTAFAPLPEHRRTDAGPPPRDRSIVLRCGGVCVMSARFEPNWEGIEQMQKQANEPASGIVARVTARYEGSSADELTEELVREVESEGVQPNRESLRQYAERHLAERG